MILRITLQYIYIYTLQTEPRSPTYRVVVPSRSTRVNGGLDTGTVVHLTGWQAGPQESSVESSNGDQSGRRETPLLVPVTFWFYTRTSQTWKKRQPDQKSCARARKRHSLCLVFSIDLFASVRSNELCENRDAHRSRSSEGSGHPLGPSGRSVCLFEGWFGSNNALFGSTAPHTWSDSLPKKMRSCSQPSTSALPQGFRLDATKTSAPQTVVEGLTVQNLTSD